MNDKPKGMDDRVQAHTGQLEQDAVVVSLGERRRRLLQASVEKTRGKLKKLERRLIRGELKKGRLRRKLLERTRALSDLEQRLGGLEEQSSSGERYPSAR